LEKEFISHSLPSKLKIVILEDMSGVPLEIDFIRLLLGWSPVLEKMIVIPCTNDREHQRKMSVELQKFPTASAKVEIHFTSRNYPGRAKFKF